ncbi:MAG: AMIN domain-containing protein [Bacillota bacterium]
MKKALFMYLVILSLAFNSLGVFARDIMLSYDGSVHKYTGNVYSLKVNNETVESDIPPVIINNRSLVPVRAIFEKLGAKVVWDGANQKVSISYKATNVELKINDYYALVDSRKVKMDVPAKIINNRTMVPLRFVGEQLNMKVGWYPEKNEITIDSNEIKALGSLNDIKYSKDDSVHKVQIALDKYSNYKIIRVPEPDRIVVDFPNTKVSSAKQNIDVNSGLIKSIRCGQFDTETARVVLDVVGKPQYRVVESPTGLVLNIQEGSIDTPSQPSGSGSTNLPSDNQLVVKHIVKSDHEQVIIKAKNYEKYTSFLLTNPDRIVVDIPDTAAPDRQQRIDVNSPLTSSVRYAKYEENGARVVVDTKIQPHYKVLKLDGQLVIYISKTAINGNPLDNPTTSRGEVDRDALPTDNVLSVNHFIKETYEEVSLNLKNYSNYNIDKQIELNRIVIDIPDTLAPDAEKKMDIKSNLIECIRYASFNRTSARIIIELKGKSDYQVLEENGKLALMITKGVSGENPGSEEPVATEPPSGQEPVVDKPVEGDPAKEEPGSGDATDVQNKLRLDYVVNETYNKVILNLDNSEDCNVFRLTGPNRIVIDIPNAVVEGEQKTISVKSKFIDTIRYSQYEKNTARVVIDVPNQPQYHVSKSNGKLQVFLISPTYRNITYNNNGDRIHFILNGAKLTEGGEFLKRLYKDSYDYEGRKYTITFPSNLADIGTGIFYINDNILDYVEITRNEAANETSIEFNAKDSFVYEINTRSYVNNTAITLLKRASKEDRLVVIDPGHGGEEPGAVYGGISEKDLNLDIAKRLNALLKSKNVKTYMMREDDSYVGLYERAYIANSLNATLFLSIHNNAFHSKYKGTETLYYPQRPGETGLTGKRFAQIVQNNLISTLNTVDRKIVERPNLVVLKATKMPAALAEIAFMTNSEDMARLKSEAFRQKAAEALCNSILQSLSEMN